MDDLRARRLERERDALLFERDAIRELLLAFAKEYRAVVTENATLRTYREAAYERAYADACSCNRAGTCSACLLKP